MIISHQYKLIFIHAHRTGGTALADVLRRKLSGNLESFPQHTNAVTLSTDFLNQYGDYYTFGFTRNPWDRILSWYSLIHLNDRTTIEKERQRLEEFIRNDRAADLSDQSFHYNTLDYFSTKKGDLIADKIFSYENFEHDSKSLLSAIDQFIETVPVLNETYKRNYRDFYTKESRELIAEKCRKDIDYFKYRF